MKPLLALELSMDDVDVHPLGARFLLLVISSGLGRLLSHNPATWSRMASKLIWRLLELP